MKIFLKILHFIIIFICLVIQLAFFERLKVFYINIDLVMVAVAGIAIFSGSLPGILYGFFAGIALDMLSGRVIGISALIYAFNGFFAGNILLLNFKKKQLAYILLIFLLTEINLLFQTGIYYLFNYGAGLVKPGIEMIINPICNIIIMFIIFPVLKAGTKRKEEIGFVYKDKI